MFTMRRHLGLGIVIWVVLGGTQLSLGHPHGAGSCDAPDAAPPGDARHGGGREGDGGYELVVNHTGSSIIPGKVRWGGER